MSNKNFLVRCGEEEPGHPEPWTPAGAGRGGGHSYWHLSESSGPCNESGVHSCQPWSRSQKQGRHRRDGHKCGTALKSDGGEAQRQT